MVNPVFHLQVGMMSKARFSFCSSRIAVRVLIVAACPAILLAAEITDAPIGFQTPAAKNASASRDKVIARAADEYRHAVLNADRQYEQKLTDLTNASQVQQAPGEVDRIKLAKTVIDREMQQCQDDKMTVALVSVASLASAQQGLHKGMTKAELLQLFPGKPESDTTDADGTERIEWVKRHAVLDSADALNLHGGDTYSTRVLSRTEVSLKDGTVVDFSIEKD